MSTTDRDGLKIFAGSTGRALAQSMCAHLEIPLGQATTTVFPDGEPTNGDQVTVDNGAILS